MALPAQSKWWLWWPKDCRIAMSRASWDSSQHTVKKYLFRIFDKLGISTRVELVLYAVSHGDHRAAEWLPGSA
jgi:hypothetical protein